MNFKVKGTPREIYNFFRKNGEDFSFDVRSGIYNPKTDQYETFEVEVTDNVVHVVPCSGQEFFEPYSKIIPKIGQQLTSVKMIHCSAKRVSDGVLMDGLYYTTETHTVIGYTWGLVEKRIVEGTRLSSDDQGLRSIVTIKNYCVVNMVISDSNGLEKEYQVDEFEVQY